MVRFFTETEFINFLKTGEIPVLHHHHQHQHMFLTKTQKRCRRQYFQYLNPISRQCCDNDEVPEFIWVCNKCNQPASITRCDVCDLQIHEFNY